MGASGLILAVNLAGSICLLLWGSYVVRSSVEKAYSAKLSAFLSRATQSWLGSFFCGLLSATALQSATAAIMLAASFITSGLLPLSVAIVVILGADLGSALAVRILFLDLSFLPSLLLIVGLCFYRFSHVWRHKQLGRIIIGLGLMLLSISLMKQVVAPIMGTPISGPWLTILESTLIVTLVGAALFTWLAHSSVAVVLVVASMADVGLLTESLATTMILGANIGSGLIALLLVNRRHTDTFAAVLANFLMRGGMALTVFFFMELVLQMVAQFEFSPGMQAVNLHIAFNLVLAVVCIPFSSSIAKLMRRLLQTKTTDQLANDSGSPGSGLDFSVISEPARALSLARREAFRLADNTEFLFRHALLMFEAKDRTDIEQFIHRDNEINARHKAIQSYLTEVRRQMQNALNAVGNDKGGNELTQESELDDILQFSTTMENVGDVVSHSLARLAIKRFDRGVEFSAIGYEELTAIHGEVLIVIQLAISRFTSGNSVKPNALNVQVKRTVQLGQDSIARHRQRLTQRQPSSISTSSIHQDTVRDLLQVVSLIATMDQG